MYSVQAATYKTASAGKAWERTSKTVADASQEIAEYSAATSAVLGDAVVYVEESIALWANATAKATGESIDYVTKEVSPIIAVVGCRLGETAVITSDAVSSATTQAIDYVSKNGSPLVENAGRHIGNTATKAAKWYYGKAIDYWQGK